MAVFHKRFSVKTAFFVPFRAVQAGKLRAPLSRRAKRGARIGQGVA